MTAEKDEHRANQCQKVGRRGFAQEGLWGTPRRPRKKNCHVHVHECDEVVGSEQSRLKASWTFTFVLPVSLLVVLPFYQLLCLICWYNIIVRGTDFYGDCPGQVVLNKHADFSWMYWCRRSQLKCNPPSPTELLLLLCKNFAPWRE